MQTFRKVYRIVNSDALLVPTARTETSNTISHHYKCSYKRDQINQRAARRIAFHSADGSTSRRNHSAANLIRMKRGVRSLPLPGYIIIPLGNQKHRLALTAHPASLKIFHSDLPYNKSRDSFITFFCDIFATILKRFLIFMYHEFPR